MKEVFKDVIGFEGLYSVSSFGRVFSLPKGDGNGYKLRELKPDLSKINAVGIPYKRVSFSVNGKVVRFSVHQLVAKHFLPSDPLRSEVNHIDGNPSNNHVSNLEWCTGSENMIHAYITGLSTHAAAIATKAASDKIQAAQTNKFKKLLGERYIEYIRENSRGWISFYCVCGKSFKKRIDSKFVKRGCLCNTCKDEDIV